VPRALAKTGAEGGVGGVLCRQPLVVMAKEVSSAMPVAGCAVSSPPVGVPRTKNTVPLPGRIVAGLESPMPYAAPLLLPLLLLLLPLPKPLLAG
jgi:hypothetical protein